MVSFILQFPGEIHTDFCIKSAVRIGYVRRFRIVATGTSTNSKPFAIIRVGFTRQVLAMRLSTT